MCGILGVFLQEGTIDEGLFTKMLNALKHRGPDGMGVWISENRKYAIGHRRLSILDLSESASQPMLSQNRKVVLSFNGEIYNYKKLKEELIKKNKYVWRTNNSDTEVLLNLYCEYGIDFIEKIKGQFAISIYDKRKNKLYLIRDRLGIKPLYYFFDRKKIIYASEIKAIITDPNIKREIDKKELFHFFSFLTTPAPNTLFEGIKKVSPGTIMEVDINKEFKYSSINYWKLGHNIFNNLKDEKKIVIELKNRFQEVVKTHKVSDVPIGVFLSGGIDSSLNAYYFSKDEKEKIKTFTIGYDKDYNSYKNENYFAKLMANKINADYKELLLNEKHLLNFLPLMVYLQDEPIADPVCVPVYYVSKLARDNNVIVCQVGEGADELFFGYPSWLKRLKLQNTFDLINSLTFNAFRLFNPIISLFRGGNTYEYIKRFTKGEKIFWGGAEIFNESEKRKLFSKEFRKYYKNMSSYSVVEKIYQEYIDSNIDKNNINWMSFLDLKFRVPELLLMRVDKMSMGVSIETRVPFLNEDFVDLSLSIPSSLKIKNNELKYILKKASEGILPNKIIYRKKQGFAVPLDEWFMSNLGDKATEIINQFLIETNIFDENFVKKIIDKKDKKAWYILNFVLWYNTYIKPKVFEPKNI